MIYELPPLSYPYDALAPYIDALTMEIHHSRHHAGYVRKLNEALANCPEITDIPLEELISDLSRVPETYRTAIRNNGGGHINHSLYWKTMSPNGGGEPLGALGDSIRFSFGGFDKFVQHLTDTAMSRFGSGWAWLTIDSAGHLEVMSTPNQDSPLSMGFDPILALDLWEHAYYLNYQNRRADYIEAWFKVVDWAKVSDLFIRHREMARPLIL